MTHAATPALTTPATSSSLKNRIVLAGTNRRSRKRCLSSTKRSADRLVPTPFRPPSPWNTVALHAPKTLIGRKLFAFTMPFRPSSLRPSSRSTALSRWPWRRVRRLLSLSSTISRPPAVLTNTISCMPPAQIFFVAWDRPPKRPKAMNALSLTSQMSVSVASSNAACAKCNPLLPDLSPDTPGNQQPRLKFHPTESEKTTDYDSTPVYSCCPVAGDARRLYSEAKSRRLEGEDCAGHRRGEAGRKSRRRWHSRGMEP